MIDVRLALKHFFDRRQIIVQLGEPATCCWVDEVPTCKAPNTAIPGFENRVCADFLQDCGSCDPFAAGPPKSIRKDGLVIPVKRVEEAPTTAPKVAPIPARDQV